MGFIHQLKGHITVILEENVLTFTLVHLLEHTDDAITPLQCLYGPSKGLITPCPSVSFGSRSFMTMLHYMSG